MGFGVGEGLAHSETWWHYDTQSLGMRGGCPTFALLGEPKCEFCSLAKNIDLRLCDGTGFEEAQLKIFALKVRLHDRI